MKRFTFKLLPLLVVFATVSCGVRSVRADEPPTSLEEIKQRLEAWRRSFVNVRVAWQLRSLSTTTETPLTDWNEPFDAEEGHLFSQTQWIWADHGLDLFENQAVDGKKHRMLEVFNAAKGEVFRASYETPLEGGERYLALTVRPLAKGKPTSALSRAPMKGLYWSGLSEWLPEVLSKWHWELEGFEVIADVSCVRITTSHSATNGPPWKDVLWLDPTHDYLVRRYLAPRIEPSRVGHDFVIDEYQKLDNSRWFPKRGRIQLQSATFENQQFVVTDVAINETLDSGLFVPPPPEVGTFVDDGHGRIYRHGVPAQDQSSLPEQVNEPARHDDSVSAQPPARHWFYAATLLAMSFLLLVAGFWLRSRR